jgi:hypothetical protein
MEGNFGFPFGKEWRGMEIGHGKSNHRRFLLVISPTKPHSLAFFSPRHKLRIERGD